MVKTFKAEIILELLNDDLDADEVRKSVMWALDYISVAKPVGVSVTELDNPQPSVYVLTLGDGESALRRDFATLEEAEEAFNIAGKLGFPVLMLERHQLLKYTE